MRRFARITGTVMIVGGVLSIAWAILVWQWQDPFTALYTMYEQHGLSSKYSHEFAAYRPPATTAAPVATGHKQQSPEAIERQRIAADARAFRLALTDGQPVGRMIVPRLGLNMIVINGTAESDLMKGPGRDLQTFMPGENQLVYVAGHRTTFLAPFAHIDSLRAGDPITFELPYANFEYVVTGHRVVTAGDLSVLKSHHHEELILQACHPRFFATHRYLAYAKLVRVEPRVGQPYDIGTSQTIA